jgi:nicotinamidase-related amidase
MPIPRLRIADTALLVVDVQERLIPTIVDADRIIHNCSILIRMAREMGIPAILTEQYVKGLGRTVDSLSEALADPSARIEKTRFSAAIEMVTGMLQAKRRGTVLVCGLEAHVCVLQTVLDLHAGGRQCFVCTDAVSSGQREQIAFAYERMQRAGAVLTGVVSAMYELLEDSNHRAFRPCLELAKSVRW